MFAFTLCFADVLNIDVPAPVFEMTDHKLVTKNAAYFNIAGAPQVPSRKFTIALPPGAIIESVLFHGTREEIGTAIIEPAPSPMPLTQNSKTGRIYDHYEKQKSSFYGSDALYPTSHGMILSHGSMRKYRVVDIVCHHFAYNPLSQTLYYTPSINIEIRYRRPEPQSVHSVLWHDIMNDITYDHIAQHTIYNWSDAQQWYQTDMPRQATGFYIIIPAALASAVDTLVAHRESQGYDVHVVTREYIQANSIGSDTQEKIRNYLRENMADIMYALLVGFSTDMPWRSLVPFNNDPDSPYNSADYSPIPSDLYYAELSDPDSLSWDSDGDGLYGEVFDADFNPVGEDDPDYHADVFVGRIPYSSSTAIQEICEKIIRFDTNTNTSFKTASLLAGALYYYENEDNTGRDRNDGADYLEQLLDDGVLNRANAVTLYEKRGLAPCTYTCTDSLTRANMISYWQQKGIMYETHHGSNVEYAAKVWFWDNGNGIPEAYEITWPTSLHVDDVPLLDNEYPATVILRSCLCGNPDVEGLGTRLLHNGASAVISSSRVAWMSGLDRGGIPYHFYYRLMQDTTSSHGLIGDACFMAKTDFMDSCGFWIPAYHYNLFGDPATRQFGTLVGTDMVPPSAPVVHAEKSGTDIALTWNAVATDTSGSTEIMDCYVVYRNTAPDFVPGPSDSIGMTTHPDTEYVDVGALTSAQDYFYLVMAVDAAENKSTKSNMAYAFCKNVNENTTATDKNWTSLPWHSNYSSVSDLTADVSPSGNPLIKLTRLRDDQLFESWLWDDLFMEWSGTDFAITPGAGLEMVTVQDTFVVFAGSNDPDGAVSLNENPALTDKNWVSIPYNAMYAMVSDITDEYSPGGNPLIKITNLRDDQLFESWLWDDLFMEWGGTNFVIEDGRGYEMVTVVDTVWNPTEYTNSGTENIFFAAHGSDLDIQNGNAVSSERTPLRRMADGLWQMAHGIEQIVRTASGYTPNATRSVQRTASGVKRNASSVERQASSHVVRGHFVLHDCDGIIFTAYRTDNPNDVLTEQMVGCGLARKGDIVALWFDVGNFKTPWQNDEKVIIVIEAQKDGQTYCNISRVVLDQTIDIQDLGMVDLAQGSQSRPNEDIPRSYTFSVAPNPFMKDVHIEYAIPHHTYIDIAIYDACGRLVRTLASGIHQPGYYGETWYGLDDRSRRLASGIYFVTFKTDTYTAQEKILLLR
jgi:hypothetical protein